MELSLEELLKYQGEGESEVYIAVKGVIYDVTPAKAFYGPGNCRQNTCPTLKLVFTRGQLSCLRRSRMRKGIGVDESRR